MANDTLKLVLAGDKGEIPLDDFIQAVQHFGALMTALAAEVAGPDTLEWKLNDLRMGSAVIEALGVADDYRVIENAIRAYDAIGDALARREPIPFSAAVSRPAHQLVGLINGGITGVTFYAGDNNYLITEPVTEQMAERATGRWHVSLGIVRGEVGAISKRPHMQFTLYDSFFDRAVTCHLGDDQQDLARDIWGKQVSVTGMVYRRKDDGRPIRIRDITQVIPIEPRSADFRRARGVIPWRPDVEPSEALIRQIRDEFYSA